MYIRRMYRRPRQGPIQMLPESRPQRRLLISITKLWIFKVSFSMWQQLWPIEEEELHRLVITFCAQNSCPRSPLRNGSACCKPTFPDCRNGLLRILHRPPGMMKRIKHCEKVWASQPATINPHLSPQLSGKPMHWHQIQCHQV